MYLRAGEKVVFAGDIGSYAGGGQVEVLVASLLALDLFGDLSHRVIGVHLGAMLGPGTALSLQ